MRILHTVLWCLLGTITIYAQRTITGEITDNDSPLIGASVLVKEAPGLGTTSDLDGLFTLTIPDTAQTLIWIWLATALQCNGEYL